jgi:hypothetical protein
MNGRGHDVFATSGFGVILMYGSLVLAPRLQPASLSRPPVSGSRIIARHPAPQES